MHFSDLSKKFHRCHVHLRWVLIIPFVLQIFITVLLVGYLSYSSGQKAVENLANKLMVQAIERIQEHLNHYLEIQQQTVAINYQTISQGIINLNDLESLRKYLWQQINLAPSLSNTMFGSYQGEMIGYQRILSPELLLKARQLSGENLQKGTIFFQETRFPDIGKRKFYLVNNQGIPEKLVYETLGDIHSTTWYMDGKAAKAQIWSKIFIYKVPTTLGISAIAPVSSAGKFQGVFNSSILLDGIGTFLADLKILPSAKTLIVEPSGNIVATSSGETPYLQDSQGKLIRLNANNSQDIWTRRIAREVQKKYGGFQQIPQIVLLNIPFKNENLFVKISHYQNKYGLDWLLVTIIPDSDFMQEIQVNTHRTIFLCGLILVISIGIGIITAQWITNPILRLTNASHLLAAGKWQKSLPEDHKIAEINSLSQSFNWMSDQIKQSFDHLQMAIQELDKSHQRLTKIYQEREKYTQILEEKVKERTAELQQANQVLSQLANLDGLTQIANRRRFDEYLLVEWQRHLREQQTLSLIIIDIDYFKRYNDEYGHQGGDYCLIKVAQTIAKVTSRPTDLVARYGGEEFVVILPNTNSQGALIVAEDIKQAIALLEISHIQSAVNQYVTLSLGVSSVIPNSDLRPEDLIAKADQALYKAKNQGRNQVML